MDVSGKKAIIFGGTSGIGLAAARQLAELGAQVTVVGRNPDKAGDLPAGIAFKACDALDEAAVKALLSECAPYDILVSSATGGRRAFGPFLDMDIEGFKGSFDKLWGYANVVRHGAQHLSETGVIVLVTGAPARRPKPGQVALGAVGGAVEGLVRGIARELAPRRIMVVSPGTTDTPMITATGAEREAQFAKVTANHIIPRPGTPDEVAQGIVFAVQNDFITGNIIDMDGGWLAG